MAHGEETELKLLFLAWRHGDRTPLMSYPTDPYKNYEYLPYGRGSLNNAGRKRSYELGLYLRQTYDAFLDSEWTHDLADLRSTDVPRAVETGALVMAGLFPPATDSHKWAEDGLGQLWSPCTFRVVESSEDDLLHGWKSQHPDYLADIELFKPIAHERLLSTPENRAAAQYVAEHAQVHPRSLFSLVMVADTLAAQKSCGLELPSWTDSLDEKFLEEIRGLATTAMMSTNRQKKIVAGAFLREVVAQSQDFVAKKLPQRRKLYAYSTHDYTISGILAALGVWNECHPDFGSVIFIELRQNIKSGTMGFVIFFRNGTDTQERQEMVLPGCDSGFCPLDKFITLYSEYLQSD